MNDLMREGALRLALIDAFYALMTNEVQLMAITCDRLQRADSIIECAEKIIDQIDAVPQWYDDN